MVVESEFHHKEKVGNFADCDIKLVFRLSLADQKSPISLRV